MHSIGCFPVFPMPAFLLGTYCEDGTPDAMLITQLCMSDTFDLVLFVKKKHRSYRNILERKVFSLTMVTENMYMQADYLGLISYAQDSTKLDVCGLKTYKSPRLDVPLFENATLSMECILKDIDEVHGCIYARLVRCECPDSMLTDYRLDHTKVQPVFYDPANRWYYTIGKLLGYAYQDGMAFYNRRGHRPRFSTATPEELVYGPNRMEEITKMHELDAEIARLHEITDSATVKGVKNQTDKKE